ncbi:hypothetical protein HK097_000554 [Rhizophlyctis rosea]|uniref:Multiple myeloma tumor-associated protein 2-like N-terminal domain-containing protein n=1 Tax=Rhizophlyctis rosea TaxID=64517 RepID=A0AAD5X8Q1_9FUNG|nr:hypothetical protein HK097_000554 [Rhizophlyctis rosea]
MFHPTRGGTRGGQGLFKWEEVKDDKHRENYLGHSLNAPVGRWQKNRDLNWYGKANEQTQADVDAELAEIKRQEAEALAEALGGPKRKPTSLQSTVSKEELRNVLKTATADVDEPDPEAEARVIQGVGANRINQIMGHNDVEPSVRPIDSTLVDTTMVLIDNERSKATGDDDGAESGAERKKRKEKKKEKKKHKKKKDKSDRKRSRSRSSDRSASPPRRRHYSPSPAPVSNERRREGPESARVNEGGRDRRDRHRSRSPPRRRHHSPEPARYERRRHSRSGDERETWGDRRRDRRDDYRR